MAHVNVVNIDSLVDTDIIVAVMGPTGAGKSTFIDAASRQDGKNVGQRLKSCTSDVRAVRCTRFDPATGKTNNVVLVDTPGFDDTHLSDMEVLGLIADWLKESYRHKKKISGILYFHRITDNRMGGSPLRNLRMFGNLCGDGEALRNVILTTTMWANLKDKNIGIQRESELLAKWWKPMVERGSVHKRFDVAVDAHSRGSSQAWSDAYQRAWEVIDVLVSRHAQEVVLLQEEMVDLKKRLSETAAGVTLYNSLQKLLADQKETIRLLKEQVEGQNDPRLLADLDKQYAQIDEQLQKTFEQVEQLKISFGRRILLFFFPKKARTRAIAVPS